MWIGGRDFFLPEHFLINTFFDKTLFGSTRFALDVIINSILTEKYNDELEIINF